MGRVLSNAVTLQASVEASPGVLAGSPSWNLLEPNTITKFGAQIKTTARQPLSKLRQRRYGSVTDLDSEVEFECDVTQSALDLFLDGFFMATGANADLRWVGSNLTISGVTIAAATSAQGSKVQYNSGGPISLCYLKGYTNAANNGLKALTGDLASSGTTIPITGFTAETAPTNAEAEICGVRCTAGDLALSIAASVAGTSPAIGSLTSGNHSVSGASKLDFTSLGLTVGQYIHIGGLTSTNRFAGSGSVSSYGYARIRSIAAATLTLDRMSSTLIASDGTATGSGGTNVAVDLLFGRFYRNVAIDNAAYLEKTYQIEATWPGIGSGGTGTTTQYSYATGNYCDSITFKLPVANKATMTVGLRGLDTANPTTSRASNASTPILPVQEASFNTSSDFARLRAFAIDESGLTTDFKDISLKISNTASPDKVVGTLGAKYMNFGLFTVDIDTTCLFTNDLVVTAIRTNQKLGFDFVLRNSDAGLIFSLPTMTFGGGSFDIPVNQAVELKLTGTAVYDDTFAYSAGMSLFPVIPSASA